MAKPSVTPRKCIFCGSRKNITREHIVPDWVRNVVPRIADHHTHSATRIVPHPTEHAALVIPKLNSHEGNLGNKKLLMVCHSCNTGWMKNLQDELIPILTPLIRGDWDKFDEAAAARIAVWTAMTASVVAMSHRGTLGVTTSDRRHIFKTKSVPPNWCIWLGRASGFEDIAHSNRTGLLAHPSEGFIHGREPNTAVTTLVLGQLLFHSINIPVPGLLPPVVPYAADLGLFPIHPWGGCDLDWRWTPVIHDGSREFARIKDDFFKRILIPLLGTVR
jgi:hypothetical protein